MDWIHSLFRRTAQQIPEPMWQACIGDLPFLHRLTTMELGRLKMLCEQLLHHKSFSAAGGFQLTDEIAVCIAAQACLPVLNLTLKLYDDMAGVIVYPSQFIVPCAEMDDAGVMHEWQEPISGEAIDAGGAVVISWEDAQESGTPGYNVVMHEFAHKIDMKDGMPNGCPPFLMQFHAHIDPNAWQRTFTQAYEHFAETTESLGPSLSEADGNTTGWLNRLPLDPYAATHPAEFFAVASETFFVRPQPLADAYPEIYALLAQYYHQNPLHR